MFIRVKSKATGHEFDIHEHRFDPSKHARVAHYSPSRMARKSKYAVSKSQAVKVSASRRKKG